MLPEGTERTVLFRCAIQPTPGIEYVSPAISTILGYEPEAFYGGIEFVLDILAPWDRLKLQAFFDDPARCHTPYIARYRHADGHFVHLEHDYRLDESGDLVKLEGLARDVTARLARDEELKLLTHELSLARAETLQRLALAAEYRDDETHQHTQRVAETCAVLCRNLGLPYSDSRLITLAAPLHDIGKIGIPDKILLKPGPLTRLEHDEMKKHTSIGADILGGGFSSILNVGVEIALSHHERWDGCGYPQALKGEVIPLSARIVAVADVLDALSHDRPYKKAWDLDRSLDAVINGRGSQFDPDVIDALIRIGAGIDEAASVIDLHDDAIDGPQVDLRIGAG